MLSAALNAAWSAESGYPTKPIRLISPFAPGGGASIVARLLGQELLEAWGQPIVVDNRGGAGGVIGTEMGARAPADGYTLVMATASTIVINPLMAKAPFDPLHDFTPVAHATTVPLVLVVHPSVPVKSVKDLIAHAKTSGARLNFASSGEGTISHLAGELFKLTTGASMAHVPYKGGGQAIVDLMAGHVQTGFVNVLEALPQVKAGRLRPLAVSTLVRSAVMPVVPTVAESGVAGFEVIQWSGVMGPARLPQDIVAKWNTEIMRILARPQMRDRLISGGADPGSGSPAQFEVMIKSEIAKWSKTVAAAQLDSRR
ncbi:MAG TPA: tripartite tricarboxylate transporter substrate binding protein [Burkholderiales bacterium]|nr:tripartite tricarboxylate transporter substrate binding protein [Burkholderiales bacterium]